MNDFGNMLIAQQKYVKACGMWRKVLEELLAMEQLNPSMPKLVVTRGDHRASYPFADVMVYCHFTYTNPHGVMLFGYSQKDAQGVDIDTLTSIAFFDQNGYVKTSVDEAQLGLHITNEIDLQEFMFARFRSALDKRFKDVLAAPIADD